MLATSKHEFKPTQMKLESLENREVCAANFMHSPAILEAVQTRPMPVTQSLTVEYSQPAATSQQNAAPRSLVGYTNVFTIENRSNLNVAISIRWSPNAAWQTYVLSPNTYRRFWNYSDRDAEIRFDYSVKAGYQAKQYRLTTRAEIVGASGPIGKGQRFAFYNMNYSGYRGVELYRI